MDIVENYGEGEQSANFGNRDIQVLSPYSPLKIYQQRTEEINRSQSKSTIVPPNWNIRKQVVQNRGIGRNNSAHTTSFKDID